MTIKQFTFNPFQENTYLLINDAKECIVIDPGCFFEEEQKELLQFIAQNKLTPIRILLTHCHLDHVFGVNFLLSHFNIPFSYHLLDKPVADAVPLVSAQYNVPTGALPLATYISEHDIITFGNETLEIKLLPGHSPGSIAFYSKNHHWIIAGDVLFYESIGRTDLPLGNSTQLLKNIKEQLFVLPSNTIVYSGHGPQTTIGHEITYNPFLH
jgi:hydroxyacylglutathione hydrolase